MCCNCWQLPTASYSLQCLVDLGALTRKDTFLSTMRTRCFVLWNTMCEACENLGWEMSALSQCAWNAARLTQNKLRKVTGSSIYLVLYYSELLSSFGVARKKGIVDHETQLEIGTRFSLLVTACGATLCTELSSFLAFLAARQARVASVKRPLLSTFQIVSSLSSSSTMPH